MKKFLSLFLITSLALFNLTGMTFGATKKSYKKPTKKVSKVVKPTLQAQKQEEEIKEATPKIKKRKPLLPPIEDELLSSDNLFIRDIPKAQKNSAPIVDELIEATPKNNGFSLRATKLERKQKEKISDELDNKIQEQNKKVMVVKAKNHYDFTKKEVPVQIKIASDFKVDNKIIEGDILSFESIKDFKIGNILYKKGTIIQGRIETISASDKMGVPEVLVVDNFYLKENPSIKLHGHISKTGANRAIWVYPLYQAGNAVLYVAGFVFVPIHGGHAKISSKDNYTIYYENN